MTPDHQTEASAALNPNDSASETAGSIMRDSFIAVDANNTVQSALERIRTWRGPSNAASYVYVIDNERRLLGVVTIRGLVFNSPSRVISSIMNTNVKFVYDSEDQEQVLHRIEHEKLLALPVVDASKRLVGVVQLEQVIEMANAEAGEDMQLMVGLTTEERIATPWRRSIRNRLPWLCVNMATALIASAVVGYFENTIAAWTALVVFLPLISAVAGNAGIQGLTVVIRGMALGEFTNREALTAVRKEVTIGVINGFVLGVIIGLIAIGWKGSLLLGAVAGAAMLLNQVIGALCGVMVPLILRTCKVDPALASSIFVTTFTDMAGFFVFLSLAKTALTYFAPA